MGVGIERCALLTSRPAYKSGDGQMGQRVPFGYMCSEAWATKLGGLPEGLPPWPQLEGKGSVEPDPLAMGAPQAVGDGKPAIGGGIGKYMLAESEAQGLPLIALVWFATDGDNAQEGLMVATLMDQLLGASGQGPRTLQWHVPLAWSMVFGGEEDAGLY